MCREVAEVKAGSSTAVIQPQRVREVLTTRRQWAINSGVDADFAEQLFRIVLSETHRIEVAHDRGSVEPVKIADNKNIIKLYIMIVMMSQYLKITKIIAFSARMQ